MKSNFARFRFLPIAATLVALAGCGGSAGKDAAPSGAIAITVTEDGFEPAVVHAAAGQPVHLVVTRKTDKTCATEIAIPSMKLKKALPLNKAVVVEITPEKDDITFQCGMNMLKGKLVVK